MSLADLVGGGLAFALTLMVFSYVLGDNPLFRVAIHLFIGVAAGLAGIMTVNSVLLPRLVAPLLASRREEHLLALVPLVLGVLLLAKLSPSTAGWGNLPVAYLVGVGAAAAIGGAVGGTLLPQVSASIDSFDLRVALQRDENPGFYLVNAIIVAAGTLTTLAYFHFGARQRPDQPPGRPAWIEELGRIGQVFLAVAFGVLFAGTISAALAALIERLSFLADFLRQLTTPPVL